jgi:hypothetical protein
MERASVCNDIDRKTINPSMVVDVVGDEAESEDLVLDTALVVLECGKGEWYDHDQDPFPFVHIRTVKLILHFRISGCSDFF